MPRILMEVTRRMSCIGAGGRLSVGLRIRTWQVQTTRAILFLTKLF